MADAAQRPLTAPVCQESYRVCIQTAADQTEALARRAFPPRVYRDSTSIIYRSCSILHRRLSSRHSFTQLLVHCFNLYCHRTSCLRRYRHKSPVCFRHPMLNVKLPAVVGRHTVVAHVTHQVSVARQVMVTWLQNLTAERSARRAVRQT